MSETTTIEVPASKFYELTARVRLAAAKPTAGTPVLTHLRITVNAGTITAAATDRYRLFMDSMSIEDDQASGEFLIPAGAADDFKKLRFATSVEPASITWDTPEKFGPTTVTVSTAMVTTTYTVDEMDFPRIDRLMETAFTQALEDGPAQLLAGANPAYLADFAKVARTGIAKNTPLSIYPVGSGGQFLCHYAGTGFWGLLMGVRQPERDQDGTTAQEALQAARTVLATA